MTTLTPLTGAPIPEDTDGPADLPTALGNYATTVDRSSVPRFSTTTARDSAFSASGSISDGQVCTVAGVFMAYRSGVWRKYTEGLVQSGSISITLTTTNTGTITFPVAYGAPPNVLVSTTFVTGTRAISAGLASAPSTTGVSVRVTVTDAGTIASTAVRVDWIAFGS